MTKVKINKLIRYFFKSIFFVLILILVLILSAYVAVQTPYAKNKIAQRGIEELNNEFNTSITAEEVKIDWKNNLILTHLTAKDHHDFDFIKIEKTRGDINLLSLAEALYKKDWKFKNLKFKSIELEKPSVKVITYKGEDRDNFTLFIDKFDDGEESDDPEKFKFFSDIKVKNGSLSILNQNLEDAVWIEAQDFNTTIKNLSTKGPIVEADIKNLTFKAKKKGMDYNLEKFSTHFLYNENSINLENLNLQTNHSTLVGDVKLSYNSIDDFSDFNNLVNWNINLKEGSSINGKDIYYFADVWNNFTSYNIKTQFSGTLNAAKLKNLQLNNTHIKLAANDLELNQVTTKDFSIKGETIHFSGNENALQEILPKSIGKNVQDTFKVFGNVDYKGDLVITANEVLSKGLLLSSIGQTDINAQLTQYSTDNPLYSGTIKAHNVNLFPLINDNTLGNFSGDIAFQGKGFDPNTLESKVQAQLTNLTILDNKISNLNVDGIYSQETFEGTINSNSALVNMDLNGFVDFKNPQIIAKIQGQIERLNMNKLGLSKESNAFIQGNLDIDVKVKTLNDLVGSIYLNEVIYTSDQKILAFEKVDIITRFIGNDRYLDINAPNNIQGEIKGRYNLEQLPDMIINGLNSLIVGGKTNKRFKNKYMFFDIDLQENLVDLIMPELFIEAGSRIVGNYDGNNNELNLNLKAPKLQYEKFIAENVNVNINTENPQNQFDISLDKLFYNEITLSDVSSIGHKKNDSLFISNQFFYSKNANKKVQLNLFQTQNTEEIIVGILPSDIEINDSKWYLNKNNDSSTHLVTYNLDNEVFHFNNLKIESNLASLNAYGYYANKNDFYFDAKLEEVKFQDIVPEDALGEYKIKGLINGMAKISKKGNVLEPLIDLSMNNIFFNDYELGNLKSFITLDPKNSSKYDISAYLKNQNIEYLNVVGNIENQEGKETSLDLNAHLNQFKLDFLDNFLSSIMNDIKGEASGDISISGNISNPIYMGNIEADNFGFLVDYLKTEYQFTNPSEIILNGEFENGVIILDNLSFLDTKHNTKGYVSGLIQNKEFNKWGLNLEFESEGDQGLLVMDTQKNDNDLFYGKLFADGSFYINGDVNELEISSFAKILKSSSFTLNNATTLSIDDNSIIRFPKTDGLTQNTFAPVSGIGVGLNFTVAVENGAEINVLLDQLTSSSLKITGESEQLVFKMSPTGEMELDGNYFVTNGIYNFDLGGFSKAFDIKKGSSISWTGDPYEAALDIQTLHKRTVSNIGTYLDLGSSPTTEVNLGINLTGNLKNMAIDFDITAPRASSEIRDQLASRFYNNEDEVKNQLIGILVLRQFNTQQSDLDNSLKSNAYDLVLKQALAILNEINQNFKINVDYIQEDVYTQSSEKVNTSLDIQLSDRWFFSGTLGLPLERNESNNEYLWSGEVEIARDISKENDQSRLLNFFSRPTTFGVENFATNTTSNQTYGSGVVFKWTFDSFNEIFSKSNSDSIKMPTRITDDSVSYKANDTLNQKKELIRFNQ